MGQRPNTPNFSKIKGKQSLDGGPDWLLCRARAAAYATWICPAPFSPGNAAVSCFSPCISFPLIQIRNKKKLHHRAMHREQRQLWWIPIFIFGSWPGSLHNCHFVDSDYCHFGPCTGSSGSLINRSLSSVDWLLEKNWEYRRKANYTKIIGYC
jgi:hypothetical protein